MSFQVFSTNSEALAKFYTLILEKYPTYAPVENRGNFEYKQISSLREAVIDAPIKKTGSIKPLFFSQNSIVYTYNSLDQSLTYPENESDTKERVILGVKHCDANSLRVLDKVNDWDYHGKSYFEKRKNTFIIGQLCQKAENTCFCTSLDYPLENSDAYDILVMQNSSEILLKICTEKGKQLIENLKISDLIASTEKEPIIKNIYEDFKSSFVLKLDYEDINKKMSGKFDSDYWDQVAVNCIGCNACAFVCPTCHCFKICDEQLKDTSVRYKCYDSCNNKYFTLMAGGHNPRSVKFRRWRQRAMHKFVYYKERFGTNLCVGCGKCQNACPVDISIYEVAVKVANS